jgi:hypothetical protein
MLRQLDDNLIGRPLLALPVAFVCLGSMCCHITGSADYYLNSGACTYCLSSSTCHGRGICGSSGSCLYNSPWTGTNCTQC